MSSPSRLEQGAGVSWKVTDIRLDAFANENRIPNTTEREEAEVGQYLIMGSLHARSDRGIGLPV